MKPICFSWSLFWKCNRPPLFFAGSRLFRNVHVYVCVCVFHLFAPYEVMSFFFFNNISSYTRWWSERNVWYENKFYFSFQITLPKDMVISLGSSFWNWSLWYPSSSSLHQVESKDEKIDSKEIKKIYFSSHT